MQPPRKVTVRRDDHAAKKTREVLVHAKAEDAGVSKCPDTLAAHTSTERLRRVLYKGDTAFATRCSKVAQL